MGNKIGSWAFLVGMILAIVLGAMNIAGQLIPTLIVILGLMVGFLNITEKEVRPFLHAGTVLVLVSYLGGETITTTLPIVANILSAILYMFVPATMIVALKSVFVMAKR